MKTENNIAATRVGVATADISPQCPIRLCGYPGKEQKAEEVHDPLLVSALHLRNGAQAVLLISVDLFALDSQFVHELRQTIQQQTHVTEQNILISCTHTHSAPVTAENPAWPNMKMDPDYMETVRNQILQAAARASASTRPAEIAWATASAKNLPLGCGSRDREIGILACRKPENGQLFAAMIIAGVDPAILDETAHAVSADFPHYLRENLKSTFGEDLVVLYHTAPCGEQRPEHYGTGRTFQDAENFGQLLAKAITTTVNQLTHNDFSGQPDIVATSSQATLSPREIPSAWDGRMTWGDSQAAYDQLVESKADPVDQHIAERNVLDAKSVLDLIRAKDRKELASLLEKYKTVEIQFLKIGDVYIAAIPAELYSHYAQEIQQQANHKIFVVQLANGELQGCIPTADVVEDGGYKGINSLFGPDAGKQIVQTTLAGIHHNAGAEPKLILHPASSQSKLKPGPGCSTIPFLHSEEPDPVLRKIS